MSRILGKITGGWCFVRQQMGIICTCGIVVAVVSLMMMTTWLGSLGLFRSMEKEVGIVWECYCSCYFNSYVSVSLPVPDITLCGWLGPKHLLTVSLQFVFSQCCCCVILDEVPGDWGWGGGRGSECSVCQFCLHFFKFKKSVNMFFRSLIMKQLFVMRLSVMQVLSSLQSWYRRRSSTWRGWRSCRRWALTWAVLTWAVLT